MFQEEGRKRIVEVLSEVTKVKASAIHAGTSMTVGG
jgi:hypothetical protein